MALASGDWRHRDRTRVPGRWKQSGRDLQHTGRGALATSAQSRCMNTVPQLVLEAQLRQATTDVQLALNPSGAGRCAVATILLPHSPPPPPPLQARYRYRHRCTHLLSYRWWTPVAQHSGCRPQPLRSPPPRPHLPPPQR